MNRLNDGRFDGPRAVFESMETARVLEEVKVEQGWTWSEFADKLGVSTYTVRHDWRKKSDSIPLSIAEKLVTMFDKNLSIMTLDAFRGQKKGGLKSNRRGEVPDNWNVKLAEFYGALLGDGCIYSNMNSLCITGNANLDEDYIYYLKELCESVFNVEPKINFQQSENVVRLVLNSRKITNFLRDSGFKPGEKKNKNFELPKELYNDEILKAVLRGLFDTDGGIYAHPNTEIMLDITAKNESIHGLLVEATEVLDLPLGVTSDRVQLYGEQKVDRFLETLGSSNSRNIKRYLYYKKNRRVPKVNSDALLNARFNDYSVPYHGFMV